MNGRRALAVLGFGLVGSQAGHVLAYELRFGSAAQAMQSTGAHAYFPALAKTAIGAAALAILGGLLIVGFARVVAGRMEKEPLQALVDRWLPKGIIAHVQVNDRNRRGPGQGEQRFAPLLASLRRHRYAGDIAVEPFDYVPDGPAAAARAIGYVRGLIEALE